MCIARPLPLLCREASVLHEWLSPVPVQQFVHDHLGRAPYARPSAASRAAPLFDFAVLAAVLRALPTPDVLVLRAGRALDVGVPSSEGDVRTLLQRGCGVLIQHAERHDARLAELAQSFADDLPGEVQVKL